jgi:hypothetical protein
MTSASRRTLAPALLLFGCAAAAYGQFPERSAYDEHYAPVTLRGLKDLRVSPWVHVIPETLVTPTLEIPEVRARIEALLKRADIGYVTDAEAGRRPDVPVLSLSVVVTQMDDHSYSRVMKLDLFQPVMVSTSKVAITAATWSTSETAIATNDTPRESMLSGIDWMVFEFIKAYRQGNGKSVPKVGEFFHVGPSRDEPTGAERRPKDAPWSASQNGLQMTAWPSPVRPVVFAAIRNASPRTIHFCDYLLGNDEFVTLSARRKGDAEWTPIPLRPYPDRASIGALLCSRNDTLRPGQEMAPNRARQVDGAPKVKRNYTFTTYLTSYVFPPDWAGTVECRLHQEIFGGRHEDAFSGRVESQAFEIELPLRLTSRSSATSTDRPSQHAARSPDGAGSR